MKIQCKSFKYSIEWIKGAWNTQVLCRNMPSLKIKKMYIPRCVYTLHMYLFPCIHKLCTYAVLSTETLIFWGLPSVHLFLKVALWCGCCIYHLWSILYTTMQSLSARATAAMYAGTRLSCRQFTSGIRKGHTSCRKKVVPAARVGFTIPTMFKPHSAVQGTHTNRPVSRRSMGVVIKSYTSTKVNSICTPLMVDRTFLCDVAVENDYDNVKMKMGPETRSAFEKMNTVPGSGPCAQKATMTAIKLHCDICTELSCIVCEKITGCRDENQDTDTDESISFN